MSHTKYITAVSQMTVCVCVCDCCLRPLAAAMMSRGERDPLLSNMHVLALTLCNSPNAATSLYSLPCLPSVWVWIEQSAAFVLLQPLKSTQSYHKYRLVTDRLLNCTLKKMALVNSVLLPNKNETQSALRSKKGTVTTKANRGNVVTVRTWA